MRGQGEYAGILRRRFELACKRFGLSQDRALDLDTEQFRVPGRCGQGTLFD
jgi:hypothetical protein